MSRTASTPIAHLLRRILEDPRRRVCPDADLLQRFLAGRDEAVFEEILRRHGPMVLDVCRALLPNEADAEDAFQATFLALVAGAGSVRKRASLASWLHGVAYRTALKARAGSARRRQHEGHGPEPAVSDPDRLTWAEVRQVLHEELARLSERHREPLTLCYLQGHTQDEAAALLGLSKGTLKRRLESGRALLRERLMRRGLGPDAAMLASAWPTAVAVVPPALLRATALSAPSLAAGGPTASVSPLVLGLAEGGKRPMLATLLKLGTAAALALGVVGVGLFLGQTPKATPPPSAKAEAPAGRAEEKTGRTDRFGDLLPPGAVARLGTVRLSGPAVAAGGKALISLGGDGAVYHWDPATGKSLRRTELPLPPEVRENERSLFCLSPDGQAVAVSAGKVLAVIDVATGKSRRIEVPLTKFGSVHCIGLSPDGKTVAAYVDARTRRDVLLWDVATGKEGPRMEFRWGLEQLAFSPDGKTLAAASLGSPVPLWDVATGKQLRTLRAGIGVYGVAFSPDGRRLATGGADGTGGAVKVWEVASGKELATLRESVPRMVDRVSFSPDGKILAAGGQRGFALLDLATRKPVLERTGLTTNVFFSPDGKTLFSRHGGSVLTVWDVAAGKILHHLPGHTGEISGVAFAPDGKTVATTALGFGVTPVHLWDAATGKHLRAVEGLGASGDKVFFMPDNAGLVSGGSDGSLRLWDLRTDREVRRFTARKKGGEPAELRPLALSADGRRLVSVHFSRGGSPLDKERDDAALTVWDVATGKQLSSRPFPGWASPAFSPDASLVALPAGGAVGLEETASGRFLTLKITGDGKHMGHLVAFSPDGRHVAGFSSSYVESPGKRERVGCALHLWELASGEEVLRVDLGNVWHTVLAYAPDGRSVALAGLGFVQLRDVATGRELLTRRGPATYCWRLAFSPDGGRLAAGYQDATALIWDMTPRVPRAGVPARGLSDREIEQSWADLRGEARKAHAAGWALVSVPGQAVALLEKRLEPAKAIDRERIRKLIAALGSPQFKVRESASAELRKIADQAEPLLRAALREDPSPEQRRRIEQVLPAPWPVRSRELLRSVRAVWVLEQVGTPEARKTLQGLAAGAPAARLTREAKAALGRLERRADTP
jgi:RNA polymerase sigma factor (sigma-70 family)